MDIDDLLDETARQGNHSAEHAQLLRAAASTIRNLRGRMASWDGYVSEAEIMINLLRQQLKDSLSIQHAEKMILLNEVEAHTKLKLKYEDLYHTHHNG